MPQTSNIANFNRQYSKASRQSAARAGASSRKYATANATRATSSAQPSRKRACNQTNVRTISRTSGSTPSSKPNTRASARTRTETRSVNSKNTGRNNQQSVNANKAASAKKPASPFQKAAARIKNKKHQAKKDRAGKMFERQFEATPAQAAQNAPRAALYKAEMGKSQRYSQKLQNGGNTKRQGWGAKGRSAQGAGAGAGTSASAFEKSANAGRNHPVLATFAAAFLVICMACAYMFPTAQTYYKTMRENDRVAAEYAAVCARNEDLQNDINTLNTDAGVMNYAHAEYNLVQPGETSINVQGVESEIDILDSVNVSVQSENVELPKTWYSDVLDKVFGVK